MNVVHFNEMIQQAQSGILLYGITPPHRNNPPEKIREIAAKTLMRVNDLQPDGLILYDINDESDRNPAERPFPYLPTMDPTDYYNDYLQALHTPSIIYRCVGKYDERQLTAWLKAADPTKVNTVFVGASSAQQHVTMTLKQAYALKRSVENPLHLGGVLIAERHSKHEDEHLRILDKQAQGCSFFISQIVYNGEYIKSMLSDYYYHCKAIGRAMVPMIISVSVCGSVKTLSFMKWLGIHIPKWLENEIVHSEDPLAESYDQCIRLAGDVMEFCRRLGVPFGFNIESVSNRLVEIEASIRLAREVREMMTTD